jgi:ankyrin repeat protein
MSDNKMAKVEEAFAKMENGAETLKELRARGADALHLAAFAGVLPVLKKAAPANTAQGDLFGSAWGADARGNGVAHYAIEGRQIGALREALAIGGQEEANRANAIGRAPLHLAVMKQDKDAVGVLLAHGALPAARNRDGDTPLHAAAWNGDREMVAALVAAQPEIVNAPNGDGMTALMIAAQLGEEELARDLGKFGANPAALDAKGKNALHYAEEFSTLQMARLVESLGANPDAEDLRGRTPHEYRIDRDSDARKDKAWTGYAKNLRSQRTAL